MTPAGWYPDPANAAALRWWDGQAWTEQLHAVPTQAPTPVLATAGAAAAFAPTSRPVGAVAYQPTDPLARTAWMRGGDGGAF